MHESEDFPGESETDVCTFLDPRYSNLGVRVVCADGSFEIDDPDVTVNENTLEYDLLRYMMGISEGSTEIGGQFPLNMHIHILNGVSFNKGCYIGQELTQRTHYTGVVRRIALPFLLISNDKMEVNKYEINSQNFIPIHHVDKEFDLDIKGELVIARGEDGKPVKLGKILTNMYNTGIA